MARANIEQAVDDLRQIHNTAFGGKQLGRFTVTRDQLAQLMRVKVAQDKTIRNLREAALDDADLVVSQCDGGLYSVVGARKAARWRRLPKATLVAQIGPVADSLDGPDSPDNDDSDD